MLNLGFDGVFSLSLFNVSELLFKVKYTTTLNHLLENKRTECSLK